MRLLSVKSGQGFTLTELMVAMVVTGIVMSAVYSSYYSQQKSAAVQEQVSGMQQNLRMAMYYMESEIRMAGYDPVGSAGAGIQTPNPNSIRFTMDIAGNAATGDGDGVLDDPGEDITYALYDADGDGDNDLGRDTGGGNVLFAENIDALNFIYLDAENHVTANVNDIRSVQISVVARTGQGDPGYTNNEIYQNQVPATIYSGGGDNFRRKLLTTQVKCRNLGLE
jgi:type IV pilus assembly protein PilW